MGKALIMNRKYLLLLSLTAFRRPVAPAVV